MGAARGGGPSGGTSERLGILLVGWCVRGCALAAWEERMGGGIPP